MDDKYGRDINFDFIEVYDGLFSKDFCDKLIKVIDKHEEFGLTRTRAGAEQVGDAAKADTFIFMNQLPEFTDEELEKKLGEDWEEVLEENQLGSWMPNYQQKFNKIFWTKAYPDYVKKYSIIKNLESHVNPTIKVQKTRPTEGYHIWHCEHSANPEHGSKRVLVWMLYLNEDFEAGETEFLYQSKRVKPKTGRLVIWPAGFTHTHRGNPPIGGTKYGATGWLVYE